MINVGTNNLKKFMSGDDNSLRAKYLLAALSQQ